MKIFKRIYVEITNICNKNCNFCAKTTREPKTMSVEQFEQIVEKIKGHTKQVYFHVMGEPLLHPQIDKLLDICEQNGLAVNLTTNGSLLKQNMPKLMDKKALRKLTVSLHGYNGGNVDDYLAEICQCVNVLKQNAYVELRLWNMLDGMRGADNEIVSEICKLFSYNGQINTEENIRYTLEKNVFLNFGNTFVWPSQSTNDYQEGFCYALRTQIAILVDGSVVPCCMDNNGELMLGNIFESQLQEIIETPRAKGIYDGFTRHKKCEQLCKRCNYLDSKA